jgi:hypothetical protein
MVRHDDACSRFFTSCFVTGTWRTGKAHTFYHTGPQNPLQLTVESVHGRADPHGVRMYYELSPSYVYYVSTDLNEEAAAE